ncbi:MAG: PAS domain S-box protein [Myxococcales bacterium]|nr:PAS domain S-box protein [Myxococcales bacterium]
MESSDDAITSATLDGTITSWNRGAADLYLYPAAEMIGTSMHRLIPHDALDTEREILSRADRGESIRQYECVRLRKDGTLIDVAVTLSPVRGVDGKVIGVSSIARDLTPRRTAEAAHRQTEEKLRQAQKMEAVGRLAGGVAHDFNNLLTVVLSYSEFAIEDLKPGDPLREDMIQIKQAAMRGTDLTRQLLAFSRQQVRQPHVINLHEIVAGMRVMLKRLLGEDVELQLDARTVSGRVLADPGQIEQVVMNLAVNARDAMPDGGNVTIGISDVHVDAAYLGGGSGVPAGDYVLLSVRDNGGGMDAATRSRIFEPFFTTKDAGKGTGLGLSTVFGIVQQSGGHLRVLSERGAGSTFEAYFPQTDQVEAEISASRQLPVIGGGETILLVEDEDQVRAVASAILRRSGYHVIDTANGGEAFLISGDYVGRIHLLLTDVVMPRMSGRRLAEELAPLRPEMKVLFASGYTDDAIVHHGVLEKGVAFLQKPFTPSTLLQRVREVLDAPAQPRFDHPAAAIS